MSIAALNLYKLLHPRGRRNREMLRCTCSAFQSGSGIAPIVARDASALARILVGSADAAAAGSRAPAEVLGAYVRIILSALDTFFLGKSNIG